MQASAGLDDDEVLESDESQEPISAEEATFHEEGRSAEQPPVAHASEMRDDLHRFPRGPAPGTFLHGLLEWAGREGFDVARADAQRRRELVARRCDLRGWKDWAEPLDLWLEQYLAEPLRWPGGETSLAGLVAYQVEMGSGSPPTRSRPRRSTPWSGAIPSAARRVRRWRRPC